MIYRDSDLFQVEENDSDTERELDAFYYELQSLESFGKPLLYDPSGEEACSGHDMSFDTWQSPFFS